MSPADTFYVADARNVMAAVGNKVKGKGVESSDHYASTRVLFLNIGNIHAMRDSLARVRALVQPGAVADRWASRLDSTGWLRHLWLVVTGAERVARLLHVEGASVLLHCSDGWDRTAQLSATAQMILDPYCRTMEGFAVLVEKDWLAFGHKMQDRVGHASPEYGDHERSPIFIQWVRGWTSGFAPSVTPTPPPPPPQLDVVWQLQRQRPRAFEFNERFLLACADALFSGRFGTFMTNTEGERRAARLPQRTASLWGHLLSPWGRACFRNPEYRVHEGPLWIATTQRKIALWEALYVRPAAATPAAAAHRSPVRHSPARAAAALESRGVAPPAFHSHAGGRAHSERSALGERRQHGER